MGNALFADGHAATIDRRHLSPPPRAIRPDDAVAARPFTTSHRRLKFRATTPIWSCATRSFYTIRLALASHDWPVPVRRMRCICGCAGPRAWHMICHVRAGR